MSKLNKDGSSFDLIIAFANKLIKDGRADLVLGNMKLFLKHTNINN